MSILRAVFEAGDLEAREHGVAPNCKAGVIKRLGRVFGAIENRTSGSRGP